MEPISTYLTLALLFPATIYGTGERMCGEAGQKPLKCGLGAIKASGALLDPTKPTVAVWMPSNRVFRKGWQICLKDKQGLPVWLPVTDKKGRGGFDATPAAVEALGYAPTKYWSLKNVLPCNGQFYRKK